MKRSPILRKTPLPTQRKPLPTRSAKRKAHYASAEGKAGLAHMARVRSLPCCICAEYGFRQTTPTEAHHVIHGRYSARKAPDTMTIPLCADHHRESADPSKVSLHAHPTRWKRLYGEDTRWISWVEHRLGLDPHEAAASRDGTPPCDRGAGEEHGAPWAQQWIKDEIRKAKG